jgi:hypothetical protein
LPASSLFPGAPSKKKDTGRIGNPPQSSGDHTINTLLVLLNLLKGNPYLLAQIGLRNWRRCTEWADVGLWPLKQERGFPIPRVPDYVRTGKPLPKSIEERIGWEADVISMVLSKAAHAGRPLQPSRIM